MYNLIERYMSNLTKENVGVFAVKKDILLSDEELDFTYNFIKKNWKDIISNPSLLNLDRYKTKFSGENFVKINKLYNEYFSKYRNYL